MADNIFRTRVVADTAQFIREMRQLENKFQTFDIRLDIEGFETNNAVKQIDRLERKVIKSFANIRQEIGKSVRSFKALENSIRSSNDNISSLTRRFTSLGKSSLVVADRIDRAEDQLRQFASARNIAALGQIDQRFDQLSTSLRVTSARTQQADRSMRQFRQNSLSRFTSAALFGTASAVLAAGFAARAIAGVVGEIAKLNAEFDLLARRTAIISGATEAQAKALRSAALTLGETTIFTAREAAGAQAELAKAGFEAAENLKALPGVLDLAAAGQVELKEATLIMARTLRGFSLDADQAARVTDVLAKAAVSSAVGVTDLGQAIKFVAPLAVQTGIAMEEVTAAVGLLGDTGFVGGIAGRGLRRALINLVAPSQRAADAMRELGIQFDVNNLSIAGVVEELERAGATTSDIVTIFGARAGPQVAALVNQGSEAIREYTKELENAGGTAQEIADEQLGGLQGAIIRLQSAFETMRIRFVSNTGLDNVITTFLDSLRFNLPALENAFGQIFAPVRDFLALLELRLGPALASLGNSITDNLVQVLQDGFNFLLENGDDLLAFVQGFITTFTDALSIVLDVADVISNILPAGLAGLVGGLLALRVGIGVLTAIKGGLVGIQTSFVKLTEAAAVFRAKAFINFGLGGAAAFGGLAVAIAAAAGAAYGLKKAYDNVRRPTVIANEVTQNLNDTFADAVKATGNYKDALKELIDVQNEVKQNAVKDELADDIKALNDFADNLFAVTGQALPILSVENIFDPKVINQYNDALNDTNSRIQTVLDNVNNGPDRSNINASYEDLTALFPILGVDTNSVQGHIDETLRLTGAASEAADLTIQRAQAVADNAADALDPKGIGPIVDQYELEFLSKIGELPADDVSQGEIINAIRERSGELAGRINGAVREGLVSQFAKGLTLETFKPITADELVASLIDVDPDKITRTDLANFYQTAVVDVLAGVDQGLADAQAALVTSDTTKEEFNSLILTSLPLATSTARNAAAATVEDNMIIFAGLYAKAVQSGLIDQVDDRVLTEIAGLSSQEGGNVWLEALIERFRLDPTNLSALIQGEAAAFNDAFVENFDEETGDITTSLAHPINLDLLTVQYGQDAQLVAGILSDAINEEFAKIDLPPIPALETGIDAEKFKSSIGTNLLPEITEAQEAANTADLAARQAVSAAEDAALALLGVNTTTDAAREGLLTLETESGTIAEGIVTDFTTAGTEAGANLTGNIYDELIDFKNNLLPNIITQINNQLKFSVNVSAGSTNIGGPLKHSGGFIYGLPGSDVPITAQAGEFMLRRSAVRALVDSGVDLGALNNGTLSNSYNNSRSMHNEVHIHTNTRYPETHGAKASKEIEIMTRSLF